MISVGIGMELQVQMGSLPSRMLILPFIIYFQTFLSLSYIQQKI